MFTKVGSIPRSFTKYYQADTLEQFVNKNVADISEVELFEKYAIKLLESSNFKFLGWATVKPKYLDVISNAGLGLLAIVKSKDGEKQLICISNDAIISVTREDIDNLFKN